MTTQNGWVVYAPDFYTGESISKVATDPEGVYAKFSKVVDWLTSNCHVAYIGYDTSELLEEFKRGWPRNEEYVFTTDHFKVYVAKATLNYKLTFKEKGWV